VSATQWANVLEAINRADPVGVRGGYQCLRSGNEESIGWPGPSDRSWSSNFRYANGGYWREVGTDKQVVAAAYGDSAGARWSGIAFGANPNWLDFSADSSRLLRPRSPLLAAAQPLGPVTVGRNAGRTVWNCRVSISPGPDLALEVDCESGVVLAVNAGWGGRQYSERLVDLVWELDLDPLDPEVHQQDLLMEERRTTARLRAIDRFDSEPPPLPLPLDPAAAFVVLDGDLDEGWLLAETDQTASSPWTQVVRQKSPGAAAAGRWLDLTTLVHQWRSPDWQWTLIVAHAVPWSEVERSIAAVR